MSFWTIFYLTTMMWSTNFIVGFIFESFSEHSMFFGCHLNASNKKASASIPKSARYKYIFFCQVFPYSVFNFCLTISVISWLSLHTVSFWSHNLNAFIEYNRGRKGKKIGVRKQSSSHFLCLFCGTISFSSEIMFLALQ